MVEIMENQTEREETPDISVGVH